jgi:hypothetical protein
VDLPFRVYDLGIRVGDFGLGGKQRCTRCSGCRVFFQGLGFKCNEDDCDKGLGIRCNEDDCDNERVHLTSRVSSAQIQVLRV